MPAPPRALGGCCPGGPGGPCSPRPARPACPGAPCRRERKRLFWSGAISGWAPPRAASCGRGERWGGMSGERGELGR
eukprot:1195645-Prorocentrum_minimum.AAC.8